MRREPGKGSGSQQPSQTKKRRDPPHRRDDPNAPKISQWPEKKQSAHIGDRLTGVDSASPISFDTPLVPKLFQSVSTDFVAATINDSSYIPPDSMGAVGPSQIFVTLNGRFRTFTKGGTADGAIDTTSDNFFNSVRNGSTTSDPRVVFDRLSQRWFVSMMNTTAPNRILIAVSSGPTISFPMSFTFFQFEQDLVGPTPNSDTGLFADQPSLGVDNNALYIGANMFDSTGTTYQSSTGFVVNKANLLNGTLTVTAFRRIATTSAGPFAPRGVTNMDPTSTEGYFIGVDTAFFSTLRICRISNPGGMGVNPPTISSRPCTNLTIGSTSLPPLPATTEPIAVPAQGSSPLPLDATDDRLMNAEMFNGSLWTTHSIQVDATGAASSTGGRDGMRFYQINNLTTTPTLVQAGTLWDPSAMDPLYFFVGSIATSSQGHSILASSYAGNQAYAGVAFDGRLSGDPPGALNPTVVFDAGAGSYNVQTSAPNGVQRWGDYSNTVEDPTDGMTLWTIQEFTSATNTWAVRVTKLLAPPPATPSTASPSSGPAGTTLSVTITGLSTSGSGFYDPGSSFPNRISATVNGGGVTVNSITYTDPTHITLNVTIAAGAAPTARTITVTNPDGQSATSQTPIFTITATAPITLSPLTLPAGTTNVPYSLAITASGGKPPYTYSISPGVLPAGLALNAATGVISGTPTTSGSETFTLQATDSSTPSHKTGSTQYTLNIANLITGNFSLAVNSKIYDATASPGYVGKYTVITTLFNNGAAVNSPIYLQITNLSKIGTDLNPSQPDKLLTADNRNGSVGDTQQIVSSIGANQSTVLAFLFGIGSRQTFNFFFDVYTVLPGSAIATVTPLNDTTSTSPPRRALIGTPLLIGQFHLVISDDGIPPVTPPIQLNADPLSNVGVITGPGPQSGPAVAVDPIIPTHIALAANDYATRTVRVGTSQDGGFTWHVTTLSRSALNQDFGIAINPSAAFDSRGRLSVVYTLANPFDSANAIVISESSDGMNFSQPTAITFHATSEGIIDNRPVIAIKSGAGRYVAWDSLSLSTSRYSINLARSAEGGIFGPVTTVVSDGLVSSPALALSKTRIHVGWNDWGFNSSPPYNTGGRLMVTSSSHGEGDTSPHGEGDTSSHGEGDTSSHGEGDTSSHGEGDTSSHGDTWSHRDKSSHDDTSSHDDKLTFDAPQEIARTSIGFARKIPAMPEKGAGPNLSLAVDPTRENTVYAVFANDGNGLDIFFARSLNYGKKWQIVTRVNDDKSAADQFSPAIAVDADGRINVSFYDTRLSSTFQTAHVFLARSADGNSFTNERITTALLDDSTSNPLRDYAANLGDRTGVATTDGDALVAWTDTRLGSEDIFASIVFDPYGAFVSGAGKIVSPTGAYGPNPSITGRAEFGFDFKYKKSSSVPAGSTEFSLSVPQSKFKFRFQSSSYDSLIITRATAQFKGSGKINGAGDYSFVVTVIDGSQPGGGGIDKFRIKIVDKTTGVVVYDNVPGAADQIDGAALEAITEGKIQIVD